jgi:hypothetical protein
MANVPTHGDAFISGVIHEKCRIIFSINLPSSNGGLFCISAFKLHRHAASLSKAITGNP